MEIRVTNVTVELVVGNDLAKEVSLTVCSSDEDGMVYLAAENLDELGKIEFHVSDGDELITAIQCALQGSE